MPIDFPNTPTTGQTFNVGGTTWQYDGEKWVIISNAVQYSLTREAISGARTLASTDLNNKIFECAAGTYTITCPQDAGIPIGVVYSFVRMGSTGEITIAPGASTSMFSFLSGSSASVRIRTQYSIASVYKQASGVWIAYGDIKP